MVLVLAIGDLHIPTRAADIPAKFKKLLVPGKMHKAIVTGNSGKEALEFVRSLVSAETVAVAGDWDADPALPLTATLTVGSIKIGVVHGHSVIPWGDRLALSAVARELDCDVLISGHTHTFDAFESESRFYLNPGSATGAFSPFKPLVRVPIPRDSVEPPPTINPAAESVNINNNIDDNDNAGDKPVEEKQPELSAAANNATTNNANESVGLPAEESKGFIDSNKENDVNNSNDDAHQKIEPESLKNELQEDSANSENHSEDNQENQKETPDFVEEKYQRENECRHDENTNDDDADENAAVISANGGAVSQYQSFADVHEFGHDDAGWGNESPKLKPISHDADNIPHNNIYNQHNQDESLSESRQEKEITADPTPVAPTVAQTPGAILASAPSATTASASAVPLTKKQDEKRAFKLVSQVVPSFALLDIQGNTVVVYVYKLVDGDVKVEKLEFTKKI
ncbi:Vacuolar protein sorting-associated protein 29 [Physocladia obscura]|uniref:Vacuolar protein sorting-associated protein 29 n=1 Tax=Physocladia obscura TaxID=109957 RepID=A0AAD5XJL9_9FUNG|nr:Vacuolar protein sorting-associated protein 29 [Physocladia obscura]